jgi:hypothetical protein
MSINPVQGIGPADATRFDNANSRPAPQTQAGETAKSAQPAAGNPPKQEVRASETAKLSAPLPQDEVEVQRDSTADGEIVIKYLDHSGNVILQVPSSEVLGVTRAIDRDFQREAKLRASVSGTASANANEGGKTHGD